MQLHDCSLSWLNTGTAMKSGKNKLHVVLKWVQREIIYNIIFHFIVNEFIMMNNDLYLLCQIWLSLNRRERGLIDFVGELIWSSQLTLHTLNIIIIFSSNDIYQTRADHHIQICLKYRSQSKAYINCLKTSNHIKLQAQIKFKVDF